MREKLTVIVDGVPVAVDEGTTAIAAIANVTMMTRRALRGIMLRGPLCGMGVCHECRVRIDGRPHSLSCQTLCQDGMRINTDTTP